MKTQFFKRGSFGLMLAIVPLVGGCNPQAGESPQNLVTLGFAEPAVQAVAETNATPAPVVPEAAPAHVGKAEAVPAALEEKPLPPTIKASGPLAEVIKLAQAGVDDGVMLTYITNSTSTFSLSSDEIIYLNDIGVANNVVTTMIEHDQAMKQYWANAAQAQAAAAAPAPQTQADETAAAPSYVNPPQAAPAEPQPEIVNNNYFYDTLSPYGSWVNVDGYGLCWQPTAGVVNRSWQPYCDRGHWVYTDCGWYWLSDYSWGATTFHYGRWFSHPRWGWCWWPDRVWGPSWVTWRSGGDYCGWAPLPPFAFYRPGFGFTFHGRSVGFNFDFGIGASWYTFVPFSRFCDPHPYRHRFPSHQVTQVFNKTTIINNFGSGSHNTVINHGIAPDRITSITRQEIRKVSIRDAGPTLARGTRGERLENNGRTLTVHRPNVPEGRLEPRRTTSDNLGKGSPYAPVQTAGENSSRGNQAAFTPNKRAEPRPATTRSTFDKDRSSRPTARIAPAGSSTEAPTAPATVGSRSSPTSRNTPDSQSNWRTDDIRRGNDRASQGAPATAAPAKQTTPASPIVVIGRRDGAQPRDRSTATAPAPQTRVAEVEPRDMQVRPTAPTPSRNQYSQPTAPSTAPSRNYNPSPVAPQPIQRQEIPRSTRSYDPRPSYSAPEPVRRQTAPSYSPSYSPPPSAPAPTPRYERPASPPPSSYQQSAPRSAPAPSYSPPASSPAPVQRTQPSPPSRSDSGGGAKGRNQ